MTPEARPFIARIPVIVLHRIPVPRMGADTQPGPDSGAVTLHADIAVVVTGLTGLKISPRLPRMIGGPLLMTGKISARVAGLALVRSETGMVGADGPERNVAELPPVRKELQVLRTELRVALAAVSLVMAAGAVLRIILGLQGMDF